MKVRFALVGFALAGLAGCGIFHARGRLYPVEGPLAQLSPPPIYSAVLQAGARSGTVSAVLANGETCKGRWGRVSTAPREGGSKPPAFPDLKSTWDAVYGEGFYTAHVLGEPIHIEGQIPCDKGTVLQITAIQEDHGTVDAPRLVIRGIAKDNKGNLYKLAF